MSSKIILGASGFIGTNLVRALASNQNDRITVADRISGHQRHIRDFAFLNVACRQSGFDALSDYDTLLYGQDIVYHLISTTVPTTSNQDIAKELIDNVVVTTNILNACIRQKVKRLIFISSGGTVYGRDAACPIKESSPTNPISSYGLQKLAIEKLLYLYHYNFGLDYKIVRLANPYGPYQRPNGIQGVIAAFVYKALNNQCITVYGDGGIIRDYIYIDDAIRAILNISEYRGEENLFNVGSGTGTSLSELLGIIEMSLDTKLNVSYESGRRVDVPVNYLDISRYLACFPDDPAPVSLPEGIKRTADFLKKQL